MEGKGSDIIAAFDSLLTTNHIQMLKVFLSYLAPGLQGGLAVYIKFLELQHTLQFLKNRPQSPVLSLRSPLFPLQSSGPENPLKSGNNDTIAFLDELMPFGSPGEQERIQSIKNMMQTMNRMQEMMEMMEMLKELFPEGMNSEGGNPMDILSGMTGMPDLGGMDLSSVFDMFGKKEE
ncbi:MAG: hypothetical protein K2O06_08125 [Acetatifactor sp.]|nr:hypothetical protein [Acetatifactor sp.]